MTDPAATPRPELRALALAETRRRTATRAAADRIHAAYHAVRGADAPCERCEPCGFCGRPIITHADGTVTHDCAGDEPPR